MKVVKTYNDATLSGSSLILKLQSVLGMYAYKKVYSTISAAAGATTDVYTTNLQALDDATLSKECIVGFVVTGGLAYFTKAWRTISSESEAYAGTIANLQIHLDGYLSGIPRIAEVYINGTPWYYKVYPKMISAVISESQNKESENRVGNDLLYISIIEDPIEDNFPLMTENGELKSSGYNNSTYALSAHNHSGVYSLIDHDHSGVYDPSGTASGLVTTHTSNVSNPHSVTKTQIGLGNVNNTADANKSVKYATTAGNLSGTPTLPSGTNLANCTFPTLNQNTTGSSGSCTGNAATASSAPASDVYSWAKAATKPTYTYTEVGADASGTASSVVSSHESTYNHSNYNTAYTDRMKWNGGSTGLVAATGRASLGLGSAATQNTTAFDAAGTGAAAVVTHTSTYNHANYNSHLSNTSNPHSVTKSQVGLGSVDNTADANKSVNYATTAGSSGSCSGNAATATTATNFNNGTSYSSGGNVYATTFNGSLTGNVTGNCSGSSGSCSGNAATATKLAATKTIGGVAFDGSGNITVKTATEGFTVTGALTATGNITAYYSDDRLKDKLGRLENALDKICALEGFIYKPNQTAQDLGYEDKQDVGLSAQSVQSILPEAVAPAPIDNKYLTIRYERLIPLIIEAIKELRDEICQ